jgi:hypothetical protein
MSGALLQLAALSSQDVYLTGNPEITLFKKSYLRYTNFSFETVQVAFDGGVLSFGSTTTATLEKSGDLISRMVLVINLKALTSDTKWGYVDRLGHAIIDNIKISIGQSDIDLQYKDWIDIYQHINKDKSQEENYNIMIGNIASLKKIDYSHDEYKIFIPLEFWTSRNSSSAFPICSLINQQFQVSITFRPALDIINYYGDVEPSISYLPEITSGYLLVDYIYLETEERNLFMTNKHDYLIEVVQDMTDTVNSVNKKVNLIFDKPTKYLVWYAQLDRYSTRNQYMVWSNDNNWELARTNFAKLVWLITRNGLDASDSNNPIINFGTGYVNIGQVPTIITGGNTLLASLAAKVDGLMLFAENNNGDIIAKATIDNVILTRNEITFEDMSTTNDEFKADSNTTTQQLNFLNIHTYSIIDIFNYGNFINRSDNPIISSSFQLNGKNRFQERDGFFYNYLQPYYYFTNSPPDGVNIYTFSLHPTDTQPSGTINLGYVNSKDLILSLGKYNNTSDNYLSFFKNGTIRIFAYGYNLIRIVNGQAGLSY